MQTNDGGGGSKKQSPPPGSPAATSRAASDLAHNLQVVLDCFDMLRAADSGIAPKPVPWWWNGYTNTTAWPMMIGSNKPSRPNRAGRTLWAYQMTIETLGAAHDKWDVLASTIELATTEKVLFASCKEGLRNLRGILYPAQPFVRLRRKVIPVLGHLKTPPGKNAKCLLEDWRKQFERWGLDESLLRQLLDRLCQAPSTTGKQVQGAAAADAAQTSETKPTTGEALTPIKIAEILGCDADTVRNYGKKAGVPKLAPHNKTQKHPPKSVLLIMQYAAKHGVGETRKHAAAWLEKNAR